MTAFRQEYFSGIKEILDGVTLKNCCPPPPLSSGTEAFVANSPAYLQTFCQM